MVLTMGRNTQLQAVVAELVTVLERNNELSCDQQIREMDLVGHNGVAAGDRRAADRQTKETTTVSEV